MSIINDALKKLQKDMTPRDAAATANAQTQAQSATPVELTPAQKAGFQPVPEINQSLPTDKNPQTVNEIKIKKPAESRLVYILGTLCLLTGLFAPIMNKQSVIEMLIERWPQKPPAIGQKEKSNNSIEQTASESQVIIAHPVEPAQTPTPSIVENIKKMVKSNPAITTPAATSPAANRIIVNGIMSHEDRKIVLIDGQIYEEGAVTGGIKIIKINADNIVVLDNDVERTIKVMGR